MTDDVSSCSACGKSAAADPLGDHQVGCGGNGDRIHRHDSIRDTLFSAAQSAALAPQKEVPTLIPGTRSRSADIFIPNWCRGRPAALDVTVISTMQPLTQSGAASEKGYALKVAEERKMAAHNAECRGAGVSFVPLAVESLGGWSHEAALQIARIGRLVGQRLGTTPAETVSHLFQHLSICLWRGNATCGLAAFHPTQLGLMGTFRYTFTVIVCTCFCIYFLVDFVFCLFLFVLFLFCLISLMFSHQKIFCSDLRDPTHIKYVRNKVETWTNEIKRLAQVATSQPHAAFAAFTHGLSSRWSYLTRTIPDIQDLLLPLEKEIHQTFIPAITGMPPCSELERDLLSLPARLGGMGQIQPLSPKMLSSHLSASLPP